MTDPSASAPALARALGRDAQRAAQQLGDDPDVAFVLQSKERQIADAIARRARHQLHRDRAAAGTPEPTGPFSAGPPAMPPVVPGQRSRCAATFTNRSPRSVARAFACRCDGARHWTTSPAPTCRGDARRIAPSSTRSRVTVPDDAALTRPYFSRASIQDARYTVRRIAALPCPRVRTPLVRGRPATTSTACRSRSAVR